MNTLDTKIESSMLITEGSIPIINFLKNNNIITINHLLNINIETILKKSKLSLTHKYELYGLINLLKCKYQNIPITHEINLETKLIIKNYGNQNIYIEWPNNILSKLGFNQIESKNINQFATLYCKKDMTIIDIFKKYINNNIDTYLTSIIKEKMSLHITSYNYTKLENNKNITYLEKYTYLKNKLEQLISKRNDIDNEIISIKNELLNLNIEEIKKRNPN